LSDRFVDCVFSELYFVLDAIDVLKYFFVRVVPSRERGRGGCFCVLEDGVADIRARAEDFVDDEQRGASEVGLVGEGHLEETSHKRDDPRDVLVCAHGLEDHSEEVVQSLRLGLRYSQNDLVKSPVKPVSECRLFAVDDYGLQFRGSFRKLKKQF
jgi:hypothetical protein